MSMFRRLFLFCILLCGLAWHNITAATKLEAEKAKCLHSSVVSNSQFSKGKAVRITEGNGSISFSFKAGKQGKYKVYVTGSGVGGEKHVNCSVGGNTSTFKLNSYGEVEAGTFIMKKGTNEIVIKPSWTWFDIDYIRIERSKTTLKFDISPVPVDPEATDAARKLYSFLLDNFGKKTISGIMTGDMSSANGNVCQHADMVAVYNASGKYPALVGFDFMNTTGRSEDSNGMSDYSRKTMALAKDIYRKGGIPAFTWHWRDPSRKTEEFYTEKSDMKISNALNPDGSWNTSSQLYKYVLKDIDRVADCLLQLQEEGIACIFRPLHEASGGWFWWGREGSSAFRQLYKLIFDEMVKVKGVHNVIWVWNAGVDDAPWNPGNEYYDVVSADIYNGNFDYSSSYTTFDLLKTLTKGKKIIALSENGPIPDIQSEFDDEAVWSWWMPWYQTWNGRFVSKTSNEEWHKCMEDSRVITLENISNN